MQNSTAEKVQCLNITLRGLKDQLNEFNQAVNPRYKTSNARRGESIIHLGGVKERRKRDKHVLGAQHVPVDRYAGSVTEIN